MKHSRGTRNFFSRLGMAVPVLTLLVVLVLAAGCTSPQGAATGDTVRVSFRMAFPGGPVFESNENGTPLVFVVGSGQMIKGFDQAVVGMVPGETRTVTISPEQGYGVRNESLVGTVDTETLIKVVDELEKRGTFTEVTYPGIGDPVFVYQLPDNTIVYYTFRNITEATTTVDQNHPLAGRDLEATITLVEIVK